MMTKHDYFVQRVKERYYKTFKYHRKDAHQANLKEIERVAEIAFEVAKYEKILPKV